MKTIKSHDGHFSRCEWLINNAEGFVLDVGCENKKLFPDLIPGKPIPKEVNKKVESVIALDILPLKFPDFIQAKASFLPFKDYTFDTVVLGDILEHLHLPLFGITEATRVSKNKVLISVPNEWEWSPDKRPFETTYHLHFFDLTKLTELLIQAGSYSWETIRIEGGGWSFFCVEIKKS